MKKRILNLVTNSLLLSLFLSISFVNSAKSQEIDLEAKLNALKLERIQAEVMITNLEKSGRLSHEEALEAKREIASVNEENIEDLKSQALEKIKTNRSLSSF